MQRTKDHTRNLLLETARRAFFQKGFKAVSMREISGKSGVGLSNIYNYYPNKDSLLEDVLQPLLKEIERFRQDHNSPEQVTIEVFTSEKIQREWLRESLNIVSRFRNELKLLLFSSQGSKFENYVEEWISKSTEMGLEYIGKMKAQYPQLHTDVSPFFIHFASSWWINMTKEVVQHENLSEEEMERFVGEYIRFSTGGWEKLMQKGSAKVDSLPRSRIYTKRIETPPIC
ncbi:MAG: TetR/AcrR family transcriptional regulator [Porphyromonas sp.]|nr:TetR/AcrR family transcriptional regulator [Porphyromonas sp.]